MLRCFTGQLSHTAKVLRPLGLAVTASDYLELSEMDPPKSDLLHRCLQRFMMKPSFRRLESFRRLHPVGALGFGGSRRLRDRVLERQHSLGAQFTKEALVSLCKTVDGPWTLLAKQCCFSTLAACATEAFQSQDRSASSILAWTSHSFGEDSSRGRLSGFRQDRSERDHWLPAIQVEHERPRVLLGKWMVDMH